MAALLGAEEFGFGTAILVSIGAPCSAGATKIRAR